VAVSRASQRREEIASLLVISDRSNKIMNTFFIHDIIKTEYGAGKPAILPTAILYNYGRLYLYGCPDNSIIEKTGERNG